MQATTKYLGCNHHHELTDDYEIIDLGTGPFVANKRAIPLLKALNEAGLITRSHHHDTPGEGFITILLDNAHVEVRRVNESDATRTAFDGKYELLLSWDQPKEFESIKNEHVINSLQ